MNCIECQEIISAAQDAEASAAELSAADMHLTGCEACRDYQRMMPRLREVLQRWPDEKAEPGSPRRRPVSLGPHRWSLAAALILAAGLGFLAGRKWRPASGETTSIPTAVLEEKTIYPETNEIKTKGVLLGLDASRLRLR